MKKRRTLPLGAAFFLPLGQGKRKDAPEGVLSKGKNMKKKTAWVG